MTGWAEGKCELLGALGPMKADIGISKDNK